MRPAGNPPSARMWFRRMRTAPEIVRPEPARIVGRRVKTFSYMDEILGELERTLSREHSRIICSQPGCEIGILSSSPAGEGGSPTCSRRHRRQAIRSRSACWRARSSSRTAMVVAQRAPETWRSLAAVSMRLHCSAVCRDFWRRAPLRRPHGRLSKLDPDVRYCRGLKTITWHSRWRAREIGCRPTTLSGRV